MGVNLARTQCHRRPAPAGAGFTLLELLVCIGVLIILASSLAAAASKAQASVRRASCNSNLRQWGLATHQYALDHEDHLPPDGAPNGISRDNAWYVDLPGSLGIPAYPAAGPWRTNSNSLLPNSLWICPANRRRSNGNLLFHYTLNRRVNGSGPDSRTISLAELAAPSETLWIFDNGKLAAVAAEGNVHTNLHAGGANFLFLDGHVQRFAAPVYWDFRRNRPVTNAPSMRWYP